jgi:hypothetical protein
MDFMEPNQFKTANRSRGIAFVLCCILLSLGGSRACDVAAFLFENLTSKEQENTRLFYYDAAYNSTAVFLGKVEQVSLVPNKLEQGLRVYKIGFRILRVWKGKLRAGSLITLKAIGSFALCYSFQPNIDETWIVWVGQNTGELDHLSKYVYSEFWKDATFSEVVEFLATQVEPVKK